jgi:hypothetical protein
MVHNPHIQKRAQEELDTVIGHGRLPTMDDRSRLPYMNALLGSSQVSPYRSHGYVDHRTDQVGQLIPV